MSLFVKYALVIAVAIFVQGINAGLVRRSADASSSLQTILDNAKNQFQTVSEELSRLAASSNVQEMTPILLNKTAELRERVQVLNEGLKRQMETQGSEMNERTAAAMSEAVSRLNASLEHLQAQGPAVGEGVASLQEQFNANFKSTAEALFEEMGKVARATSQDAGTANNELTNISKNALVNTMDVFAQMQNQFQQALSRTRS